MPWMSPHPCRYPGCGTLIKGPRGLCTEHQPVVRKRDDEARPGVGDRGYGWDWQKRRAAYLEEHPFCVRHLGNGKLCGAPSTVGDHIVPLSQGGADGFF